MDRYEQIKIKYGEMSSWAIYSDKTITEKSGMDDISFFEDPSILPKLKPNIVLVGLNISEKIKRVFGNFHPTSSSAQDYKIRHAIKDTMFEGAYMTDIIKDFEQKHSGKLMKYLSANKEFEKDNVVKFEQELQDIGSTNPIIIIAFGSDCYKILQRNLKDKYKYKIHKVTHYSAFITKDKLRTEFEELAAKLLSIDPPVLTVAT
jgi:hypothetical protein